MMGGGMMGQASQQMPEMNRILKRMSDLASTLARR